MIKERFRKIKLDKKRAENNASELEQKNRQLTKLKTKLHKQLEKAKKLHHEFLPKTLPNDKKISTAVYYMSAQKLGGDFYNFIEHNNKLIAYIVDIMGHGLDGALLSIFVREAINNFLENNDQTKIVPSQILKFVHNKYNQENFSDDYFICVGLFVLDKVQMNLTYSNAGLQFPPLIFKEGKAEELVCRGLPISSAISLANYEFEKVELDLNAGNKFLIMTDGIIEQPKGRERYGQERIKKIMANNNNLTISEILNKIEENFQKFIGEELQSDDVTLIGIESKV